MKKENKKINNKVVKEKEKKVENKKVTKPLETEEVEEKAQSTKEEKPVKKKKRHIFLKIVISLLVIFIIFPIAFVFIAFYDTSTKNNLPTNDATYENIVGTSLRNGLENVASTGKITLSFGEQELDGVLIYAYNQLAGNQMVAQFLDKMYCYIDGKNYNFYADFHASFFKTRLVLETELVEDKGADGTTLTFKINTIKVGRLPLPTNLLTSILGKFITNETIESSFKRTGFNIHCDLANAKITYKQSDFQNDVAVLLSKMTNDNHYIQILLELMGDDEIIDISFENAVSAIFSLQPLAENDNYHKTKDHYFKFSELGKFNAFIIDCLNKIPNFENDAEDIFTYLIKGNCSSETIIAKAKKKEIEDMIQEFTNTPIDDYKGTLINDTDRYADVAVKDVKDLVGEGIKWADETDVEKFISGTINTLDIFTIDSDAINRYLASIDSIIGKTILSRSYNEEENSWKSAYIIVDNLYTEIADYDGENKLIIYLGLNINGFETTMIIPTTIENTLEGLSDNNIGNVKLNVDKENGNKKLFFGRKLLPSNVQNILMSEMPLVGSFKYNNDSFLFNIDEAYDNTAYNKNLICQAMQKYPDKSKLISKDNKLRIVVNKF